MQGLMAVALPLKVLIVSLTLSLPCHGVTQVASCADPTELNAYKARFDDAVQAVAACQATRGDVDADRAYLHSYYKQEIEFRKVELDIYRWQITAANAVLFLVGLLTVFGIIFSGYQLWRVNRIPKAHLAEIEIELSLSKLRIQTSIIGAIVLFVSYAFLLVFTRDIYTIRKIETSTTRSQGGAPAVQPTLPKQ